MYHHLLPCAAAPPSRPRHQGCGLLQQCLDELAAKYPSTKFLRIVSTDAIPHYPDANLPTLLLYHDTQVSTGMKGGQILFPLLVAMERICLNDGTITAGGKRMWGRGAARKVRFYCGGARPNLQPAHAPLAPRHTGRGAGLTAGRQSR